jgi:hypothetical protein
VRGLNARAHRNVVRELVASECLSMVCLQEMKLEIISDYDVIQIGGHVLTMRIYLRCKLTATFLWPGEPSPRSQPTPLPSRTRSQLGSGR